jgi:hypothetical protein
LQKLFYTLDLEFPLGGNKKRRATSPLPLTLIGFHSFHAMSDGRAAAGRDWVTGRVADLKGNLISERIPVITNLDGPHESVCRYQVPGSTKDEGVGHSGVIMALCVPPDPQLRRE